MRFIPKYQYGGVFEAVANPAHAINQVTNTESTASSKKSSSDSGILSKEVANALDKEGLPSDVSLFYLNLQDFERESQYGLGVSKSKLYNLKVLANHIILSSKSFEKAEQKALKNNSLDSVAIDSRGFLYVTDQDGNVSKKHITKYDSSKEGALTYGELLDIRKFNPKYAFDELMISAISGGVGMETVQEYLKNIIETVGKSSSTTEAYQDLSSIVGSELAKRPTEQQMEAIKLMYQTLSNAGPDALFKVKDSVELSNIPEALNYISRMLPPKIKNLLMADYVVNQLGDVKNSGQYVQDMIISALASSNKTSVTHTMDFDAQLNKAVGTQAGKALTTSETPKSRPETGVEQFFNQLLNRQPITISNTEYKNRQGITSQGSVWPSLMIDGGTAIGPSVLSIALAGKGMGKYLDYNHSSFGRDKMQTPADLLKILYTGDEIANVWLPVDMDGNIDWTRIDAFSQAENQIKINNLGDTPEDIAEKNRIHRISGSGVQYDDNNLLTRDSNVAQFLMLHGYTIDDTISDNNSMYKELNGEAEQSMDQLMNSVYEAQKVEMPNKNPWDDIIKLPVFLKIRPDAGLNAAFYARHGSEVPKRTIQEDMVSQMISQAPEQQIFGSAAALYQA